MRASVFVSAIAFAVASAQSDSDVASSVASEISSAISSIASEVTSSVDAHPQTTYLAQTNSLGVVTGMPAADTSIATQPAVETNQPAVVTSQPLPDDIPAIGTGVHTLTLQGTGSAVNSSRTVTVSANNSTTVRLEPSTTSSGSKATGSDASATGTGADASGSGATGTGADGAQSTGAASNIKAAAGSIVGFGAFMAAFL